MFNAERGTERFLMTTSYRWTWIVAAAGLLVMIGAAGYVLSFLLIMTGEGPLPSPRPPRDPADVSLEVHNFCGAACHAYPPPDTFPRKYWRTEVERGFRFFEQSARPVKPPPIESVIRYYEEKAPDDLPAATWPPESRPLGVKFEPRSYPGPAVADRFAISNVNLVHLPDPSRPAPDGAGPRPLDVLACDMRAGLVMLLRPYEPSPSWKVLAK